MKKVAASLVAVAFVSTSAFGGIVSFNPTSDICPAGGCVTEFEVTVTTESLAGFDAADILFGSTDLAITGFTYSQAFIDGTLFQGPPGPSGVFANDLLIGGFGLAPIGTPLMIGTLTVDSTGLLAGDYTVFVDSGRDGGISSLQSAGQMDANGLFGEATVTVVPEPATISLLGLAAVGLIRRRKA